MGFRIGWAAVAGKSGGGQWELRMHQIDEHAWYSELRLATYQNPLMIHPRAVQMRNTWQQ